MIKEAFNLLLNTKLLTNTSIICGKEMKVLFQSEICGEPSSVKLNPVNYTYHNIDEPFFLDKFPTQTTFSEPFYSIVPGAYLCGHYATAIAENGKILLETTCGSKGYLKKGGDAKFILGYKLFRTEKVIDYAFSLVNILSKAYFHWVAEVLPTLEAYFAFEKKYSIRPKLIVDHQLSKFQKEYLELFGFGEADFIYWNYKKIKVKNLIVPSLRYDRLEVDDLWAYHLYSKSGFDFLIKMLSGKGKSDQSYSENVIIDRSDVKTRRILNQHQLEDALRSKKFESVILGELSISQQIQLFRGIKKLISPHGAGLINTIFSDHIDLIELFPVQRSAHLTYHFYEVSSYYKHRHVLYGVKGENEKQDITINTESLSELLMN